MISGRCPYCEKWFRVPDDYGGKPGRCRGCKHKFRIPTIEQYQSRKRAESMRKRLGDFGDNRDDIAEPLEEGIAVAEADADDFPKDPKEQTSVELDEGEDDSPEDADSVDMDGSEQSEEEPEEEEEETNDALAALAAISGGNDDPLSGLSAATGDEAQAGASAAPASASTAAGTSPASAVARRQPQKKKGIPAALIMTIGVVVVLVAVVVIAVVTGGDKPKDPGDGGGDVKTPATDGAGKDGKAPFEKTPSKLPSGTDGDGKTKEPQSPGETKSPGETESPGETTDPDGKKEEEKPDPKPEVPSIRIPKFVPGTSGNKPGGTGGVPLN